MRTSKTLNPIDLVKHKKQFYWDQQYYGLYEEKDLISYLVFKKYFESEQVLEIKNLINPETELLKNFVSDYGKQSIKYFLREIDEKADLKEFEAMQNSGFKRIKRNFYYEYHDEDMRSIRNNPEGNLNYICREAYSSEIEDLIELEKASQAIEYREHLYKERKSYIKNSHDTYVFIDPKNSFKKYALCTRTGIDDYEFIVHPNLSGIIPQCIEAFAEILINYSKKDGFTFFLSDCHKSIFKELENKHKFKKSTQVLLAEGIQRKKSPSVKSIFFTKPATG